MVLKITDAPTVDISLLGDCFKRYLLQTGHFEKIVSEKDTKTQT